MASTLPPRLFLRPNNNLLLRLHHLRQSSLFRAPSHLHSTPHPLHPLPHQHSSRPFYSSHQHLSNQPSKPTPTPKPKPTQSSPRATAPAADDTIRGARFSELGASRNVKLVLLVALSVIGSVETYFWIRAGLRWWRGDDSGAKGEEDEEEWWWKGYQGPPSSAGR